MATFTWIATKSGTTAWATTTDWVDSTNSSSPSLASLTASPGNDYVINGSNLFTINNIGAGGTAAPNTANSLTLSDVQAKLQFAVGGALNVATTLTLNSLLNLGTAGVAENSVLSMGGTAGGGTINFSGTSGVLEGALGDSVKDVGTSPTQIIGSGTILAEGGVFNIGTSVQVASGTSMKFQIDANATLAFADAVGSGTVVFGTPLVTFSPSGVLDVAALSSFNASVKGLFVATVTNTPTATSYIDFLNVGTTATATLTNITSTGATLTIFTNSGSQAIPIVGNYVGKSANVNYVSDGHGGTNVFLANAPCYLTGTAILTPDGEVAVETIQPGDIVLTSEAGTLVPQVVKWAGFRELDIALQPEPASVAPIRLCRGALGPDLPHRDLFLSPDHCLFIDGGLVPAKLLVNGMTITRDLSRTSICYHHIELDRHGLLIAEGVEAESYLDTGNRAYFSNAGLAMIQYPEFGINERLRCWETDACAPLLVRPDAVKPVWERLANRAQGLGFEELVHATTPDPDLHLVVDGRTVRPLTSQGDVAGDQSARKISFVVPDGAVSVRLVSRRAIPVDARPWQDDPRLLGVAVRSLMLRDRTGETVVGADHPALTDGWHAAEYSADGATWRWTRGDADLPIVSNGPCLLEIALGGDMTYIVEEARQAA